MIRHISQFLLIFSNTSAIHLCKTLGFSNCNFDSFCSINELVDHLTLVHKIQKEASTQNFLSLEFDYPQGDDKHDCEKSDLNVSKLFGGDGDPCHQENAATQPKFLFLMKPDGNSSGLFLLCVSIICSAEPEEQQVIRAPEEYRAAFYFTSGNVSEYLLRFTRVNFLSTWLCTAPQNQTHISPFFFCTRHFFQFPLLTSFDDVSFFKYYFDVADSKMCGFMAHLLLS